MAHATRTASPRTVLRRRRDRTHLKEAENGLEWLAMGPNQYNAPGCTNSIDGAVRLARCCARANNLGASNYPAALAIATRIRRRDLITKATKETKVTKIPNGFSWASFS